jgi:DNA helicase IV
MKMRARRIKQTRHSLQAWFESTGYLARLAKGKAHRKMIRERFMRGDYEVIDGEFWMRDLKL